MNDDNDKCAHCQCDECKLLAVEYRKQFQSIFFHLIETKLVCDKSKNSLLASAGQNFIKRGLILYSDDKSEAFKERITNCSIFVAPEFIAELISELISDALKEHTLRTNKINIEKTSA